jgi:hypothetical protein
MSLAMPAAADEWYTLFFGPTMQSVVERSQAVTRGEQIEFVNDVIFASPVSVEVGGAKRVRRIEYLVKINCGRNDYSIDRMSFFNQDGGLVAEKVLSEDWKPIDQSKENNIFSAEDFFCRRKINPIFNHALPDIKTIQDVYIRTLGPSTPPANDLASAVSGSIDALAIATKMNDLIVHAVDRGEVAAVPLLRLATNAAQDAHCEVTGNALQFTFCLHDHSATMKPAAGALITAGQITENCLILLHQIKAAGGDYLNKATSLAEFAKHDTANVSAWGQATIETIKAGTETKESLDEKTAVLQKAVGALSSLPTNVLDMQTRQTLVEMISALDEVKKALKQSQADLVPVATVLARANAATPP